jgi:hypothetical protein
MFDVVRRLVATSPRAATCHPVLVFGKVVVSGFDWDEGGRRLTVVEYKKGNNERRKYRRSLFGCHVAVGDVAP